ncbi:hypothetical protein BGX23_004201 [Mortierella sp. AD031]|nr:hypothetical protein BGX23_004201 [Mortierella sp. AD031]
MVLVWLPQEVQKEELKDRKEIKELNEVKLKELKELRKKKFGEELRKEWQVKKMMEVQDSDHDDENTAALSESGSNLYPQTNRSPPPHPHTQEGSPNKITSNTQVREQSGSYSYLQIDPHAAFKMD